jgi:hypothetical protein
VLGVNTFEMPLWLVNSLWFIWGYWAMYELYWAVRIVVHNAGNYHRTVTYTVNGWRMTLLFLVFSAFWLSWNIFG